MSLISNKAGSDITLDPISVISDSMRPDPISASLDTISFDPMSVISDPYRIHIGSNEAGSDISDMGSNEVG